MGAGAAVLGSMLTISGQWLSRRQDYHDGVVESLRQARADAHRDLLRESHLAAHTLLRTTPGHPAGLAYSHEVEVRIDAEVMHRTFQVELVAGLRAAEAALALRRQLFDIRRMVKTAQWHDPEYMMILNAYQATRANYISVARAEILAVGHKDGHEDYQSPRTIEF